MPQAELTVSQKIDIDHLYIRPVRARVIDAGKGGAYGRISTLVMNGRDFAEPVGGTIGEIEKAEFAN